MRPTPLAVLLTLSVAAAAPLSAQRDAAATTLDDVRFLASDSLGGRLTGSWGAARAADFLVSRFKQAGLKPAELGWLQSYVINPDAPGAKSAGIGGVEGKNVIGILPGRDKALRAEAIVVGAHYDHLGMGGSFALDTGKAVHNGADDNASGTAALIRIADQLRRAGTKRTIVFVAFSGEEEGLLGSAAYVRAPAVPLDQTVAMLNLDMVGRLRGDKLIVYGVATAKEWPALLDSLNATFAFDLRGQGDGYGPSDQSSFYAKQKPVLHLFTDLHEDYHRATDDWDKINAPGLVKVADFAAAIVKAIADRPAPLTFTEAPAAHGVMASATGTAGVASGSRSSGYGAYLGTIPDMGGGGERGVRISGVRGGSPAERAGLKGDDVITKIGTMDVPDLQAMTDALRSFKPGDTAPLTYLRNGTATTVQVTFGQRGG